MSKKTSSSLHEQSTVHAQFDSLSLSLATSILVGECSAFLVSGSDPTVFTIFPEMI